MAATVGGRVSVETASDLGERVAVIATLEGAGAESGAPGTLRFGQIWSFRDGKVTLKLGNNVITDVPVGLSNVVSIAAGGYHTLALKADGTVWAWASATLSRWRP